MNTRPVPHPSPVALGLSAIPRAPSAKAAGRPFCDLRVDLVPLGLAVRTLVANHYLHRKPPISHAYGLWRGWDLCGVVTFGHPPSRHLQMSACTEDPSAVIELNRLWVSDAEPRNTETWFLSRALRLLPPHIVVSFADTKQGHSGCVYRAANFAYAGLTDQERKTPRFDYATPGRHGRDASRNGHTGEIIRRSPKHRYWTVTGDARARRALTRKVTWPSIQFQKEGVGITPPQKQEG